VLPDLASLPDPAASPALKPIATAPPVPERMRPPIAEPAPSAPSRAPAANGFHHPPLSQPPPSGRVLVPHPRDILDALALSGVYEPHAAGTAGTWDRAAPGPKRKGAGTIIASMVLFLAAGAGTYGAYRHKRAQDHVKAEAILADVETRLDAGKVDALPALEQDLGRALQLESRSPRAALDWTRERALLGLIKSGADVAFEDAMARAKELGVPEEKYAFARVASFLFQGDTAGAAAVLARWDAAGQGDAWYEVVAGATLERAGDARARQRYATAARIEPQLLLSRYGLTRTTALEGEADHAMALARTLRGELPDRVEPVALVALAWGRDPMRESTPLPPEVDEVAKRESELPTGLRFVPHAVSALRALDHRDADTARTEVRKGLAASDAPSAAVWLGTIALSLGDEELARKGALAALQFSAVYEPARALAARVALTTGRLDEALKATEDLDPTSTDVAVVRAAAAYERADADGVARALEALPADARKQPALAGLAVGGNVLAGRPPLDASKLLGLSDDDAPWSDLVAFDAALAGGDLTTADKMAVAWGTAAEAKPLRALRLARLARYENRLEAADALSRDGARSRDRHAARPLGARLRPHGARARQRGGPAPRAVPARPRAARHLAERVRRRLERRGRCRAWKDCVDRPAAGVVDVRGAGRRGRGARCDEGPEARPRLRARAALDR
jgi:hypothetical protein